MAPKKKIRNRTQSSAPEIVPIYDILSDRELDQPARSVMKKLQFLSTNNHYGAIEDSFAILMMEMCGLGRWVAGINWRQDYCKDLAELIQDIPEQYNSHTNKGNDQHTTDFLLLNPKSKFHSQFKRRLSELFGILLTDELAVVSETKTMRMMFQVLREISRCKLRNIRGSSIQIAAIVTNASCHCYERLIENRSSKRAAKILTVIEEGYIDSIFRPRFKDIDNTIRQKAFRIIEETMRKLELELMSKHKLLEVFLSALNDHSAKVTELALTAFRNLLEARDLKPATVTHLCDFAMECFPVLEQMALLPTNNGCLAMKCLLSTNRLQSNLQILKPKTIRRIFQIHGYEQHHEGLKIAVQLFYRSLVNYNNEEQLLKHSQTTIIEIAHLLSTLNSQKLIRTILQQFLKSQQGLFGFENIFTLLISEYYREGEVDIQFQRQQIAILLNMAIQLNESISKHKKAGEWAHNQILIYNKNLLENSKEIFYDRLTDSRNYENSHLYLRLFSHLFLEHISQLGGLVSFVTDQVLGILKEEKFIIMGNEEVTRMNDIVRQCVGIYHHLNRDRDVGTILLHAINLHQIESLQNFDPIDVIKFTNTAMLYPTLFQQEHFLKRCISFLSTSVEDSEESIQLLMLNFLLHAHKNMMKELFQAPNCTAYHEYTLFRDAFLDTVITMLSSSRNKMVKLGAFSALTQTFRYISNNKLALPGTLYYEVPERYLSVLLEYVTCHFMTEFELLAQAMPVTVNQPQDSLHKEQIKLSAMMSSIGFNSEEVKQKILNDIFLLFQDCHKVAVKAISFILKMQLFSIKAVAIQQNLTMNSVNLSLNAIAKNVNEIFTSKLKKFINSLITNQTQDQYRNKLVFWRFFGELIRQAKLLDLPNSKQGEIEIQSLKEDQTITEQVIDNLLNSYFKFKQKANTQISKILSDKLMLFIVDYTDKTVTSYLCYCSQAENERRFQELDKVHSNVTVIRQILDKVRRRYPKEVLHRLNIFFSNKIERLPEDQQLKKLHQYLTKISQKSRTKNSKRKNQNRQQNRHQSESESSENQTNSKGSESQGASSDEENEMAQMNVRVTDKRQQKSINKITNKVATRNTTKRKVR